MKALLDAILANPADVAVRRVYADALLEQGEPLGELMHIQLDLEKPLPRADAIARRRREAAMIRTHYRRWIDGFADVIIGQPTFRGGFVDQALVDVNMFPKRAEALFAKFPLLGRIDLALVRLVNKYDWLDNIDVLMSAIEAALLSPLMSRVRGLRFVALPIPKHAQYHDNESTSRYEWHRERNGIVPLVLAAKLPNLVSLDVEIGGNTPALRAWPVLEQLEHFSFGSSHELLNACSVRLRSAQFEPSNIEAMHRIFEHPCLRNLDALDLSLRHDSAIDLSWLRRLRLRTNHRLVQLLVDMQLLEELDLDTRFTALEELALADFPALRVLRLNIDPVRPEELLAMLEWPWVRQLEVLDLSTCRSSALVADQLHERFDGVVTTAALGEST